MTVAYMSYDLQDGFVDHWLAAGPQAIPLSAGEASPAPDWKLELARRFYDPQSGIRKTPVEPGPLEEAAFKIGTFQGQWSYYRCREDHFVDHSDAYPADHYLRSWAYTRLVSPRAQAAELTFTTFGPLEVWLNRNSVGRVEGFSAQPLDTLFHVELAEGENEILVRFEGAALPACTLAVSLHVAAEGIRLNIPTLIPSLERRAELEEANRQVYLRKDVFAAGDQVSIHWPETLPKQTYQDVRLQTPSGRIYAQAEDVGVPGKTTTLNASISLNPGPYHALLMPRAWEMYDSNIRVTQTLPCWVMGRYRFSESPYGTLEERRREALLFVQAAKDPLYTEIAHMALGRWDDLDAQALAQAAAEIDAHQVGSHTRLLGLLGALGRFGKKSEFPRWVKREIKKCALGFAYPGDAPAGGDEGGEIVAYACELLAGQLYPDQTFTASGLTGRQQRKKGEARVLAWMQARAAGGFAACDADQVYADSLMALSCLVDLAHAEAVWELASVLMDKLFFSLALNSYHGVFGSSRGRASSLGVRSGLLEATSGITRLMWGLGIWNQQIAATLNLACMSRYELPPILADIAAGLPGEWWSQEQQMAGERRVNKVTYRTPGGMLSSAQDYHPGQPGEREHIWQATLGPQCVVFVNHPACSTESDAHTPNFWLGNGALPRVAQWKDALVALYDLPASARLGFTHAYFPTADFDAYAIRGQVAFARKGDSYLALSASQGLELVSEGRTAFRELRSPGRQNVWLCQLGRAAEDGDFEAFQEKVLAQEVQVDGLKVAFQTLRGDALAFDWQGPFLCNGAEQPLSGYPHYQNPFTTAELPCRQMEVRATDYLLRLDFSESL